MKRPEKKTYQNTSEWVHEGAFIAKGYNQACDDWGGFLPNEEELFDIIDKYTEEVDWEIEDLAQALFKRLREKE